MVEVAFGNAFEQVYQVALDAQHHTFGFGVAHADVVFNHHRFALHVDKSQEDEALIADFFFQQAVYGRFDDAGAHFLHKCFVGKRHGGNAAHTAGVEAFVAFADTLVILGYGQDLIVAAVCHHEHGTLDAAEEFFNDYRGAGIAEHAAQHFLQFFLGFFQRGQNQYALACTQPVGLQNVGRFEGCEEIESFLQVVGSDAFVAGSGNVVAHHEAFGKFLAAFQSGTFGGGADDVNMAGGRVFLEAVEDALYQGVFGTHNNHVDSFLKGKGLECGKVCRLQVHILACFACTCIAGSDI